MNQSKKLTEGALLVGIYIVLLLLALFIPFIISFLIFILPIPFIIYANKYDWKPSLIMFGVTLILSILFATIFSLPTTVIAGLGGIMIGAAIHRNLTAYETWARGTVGFVFGLVFAFLIVQLVFNVNIMEEYELMVNESLQMTETLFQQMGMDEEVEEPLVIIEEQLNMVMNLIPVGIALGGIIMALVSQWLSYKIINRTQRKKLKFPSFHELRFPVSLIWIYFLALIITLFQSDSDNLLYMAMQNVMLLVGILMMIQGFSLIMYYFHAKKMSKALPITIIIVSLLFAPLLLPLVRILGIIDIGFGLRDRIEKVK